MRIYLDSCVIQELKKPNQKDLLDSIIQDKENNIYCYSEAHLQDLLRDRSAYKFEDLDFMETIVDSNCWHYDKKIFFDHTKPKEYYNPFPEFSEKLFDFDDIFTEDLIFSTIKKMFQNIPLTFNQFIPSNSLPADFPNECRVLLEKPTNFYEFFCAISDYTINLSADQKEFKKLISYLHNNNLGSSIFEQIGILGYDGKKITDKEKFRESYSTYFLKDKKEKYRYDLFLEQYNGLEFFSFVKGKPKKQQMMNMINDGRHAFFGGFCDIVVSKDKDFIEKTKFMYEIHEIQTEVLSLEEFSAVLEISRLECKLGLTEMLADVSEVDENKIIENNNGVLSIKLNKTYFSYFNVVNYISTDSGNYNYYTRYFQNMSTGTLKNEFEFIVTKLIEIFGPDAYGNSSFDMKEIEGENWKGRVWQINDTIIELNFKGKLYLAFFPIDYLKSTKIQHAV